MRSLYVRVLATLTAATLVCLLVTFIESVRLDRVTIRAFFEGSMNLQLQQARRAYEEGGAHRLAAYLAEVDTALQGQRFLTDRNGRDLVSGANQSAMLVMRTNFLGLPKLRNGHLIIAKPSADSLYYLVVLAPPPISIARFIPYVVLVTGVLALFGLLLAAGIVSPVRRLVATVERFGKGDLSARVGSNRKDEIGELANTFDSMADRIQILLTAERRLLQDISHELRSPLARLSFAAELMKNAPDPEAAAGRMKHEINRLNHLVTSLLEVTTAEGDPPARVVERVPIATVLETTAEDCAFEAEARGVQIKIVSSAPTAIVDGDPELLRRALENVLRNAIRYTPANMPVEVTVEQDKQRVRIIVRDHGPGVPEDALSHLFDPFFRVDASRDPATGNVGLGLAIARRALLVHHGDIKAENAHPGLRVVIELPAALQIGSTARVTTAWTTLP
jgi:signal transduction histidine kinase